MPKCRKGEPRQRIITDVERARIFHHAPPDMRLHMLLCGDLGIRAGTAVRVKASDWDRQNDVLRLTGMKHGSALVTPITAELKAHLQAIERESPHNPEIPYVVRARPPQMQTIGFNDPRHYAQSMTARFRRLTTKLGIRDVRTHDLRRTFAERLYRHTNDLRIVMDALGHRSLRSTVAYLQRTTVQLTPELLERIKSA